MALDTTPPVAIVFGAGKNIGDATIKKFVEAGYLVAAVSRSTTPGLSLDGRVLSIQADLTQPHTISGVFERLRNTWSVFPRVIVWIAAKRSWAPSNANGNFFSIPAEELRADFDIANTSPWIAAGEATKHWKESESSAFIYTGNLQAKVVIPVPDFTTLGVAKRAATYWLEDADRTFKQKGWRFYYTDERNEKGGPAGNPPGAESHADMFLKLSEGSEDLPSYLTFVNGEYRKF